MLPKIADQCYSRKWAWIERLTERSREFSNSIAYTPKRGRQLKRPRENEPSLPAEIEYRAKSAEGKVRHPFFKGIREDL